MAKRQNRIEALRHAGMVVALAGAALLPIAGNAWAWQGTAAKAASAGAPAGIEFSFKLDSRLTRGLYMGDRWVSPPTYTGTTGQDTIEARAHGLDTAGRRTNSAPEWTPADPEMVTVSPSRGNEVKITIKRPGESRLRVMLGDVSRELAIKAAYKEQVLQVEIAQPATEAPVQVSSVPEDPVFKSPKEKLSYAIGMNIGSGVRKQTLAVDLDVLIQGIKDTVSSGKMLMTEDQMRATLLSAQAEMKKQASPQIEKTKDLAEKNRKEGEAFLAGNKTKDGVVTLASGLQYKILKLGDGPKPTADDSVVCHYRGTLLDGTEFDSSHKRNQPATFPLTRVIKGWTESLQLMPVGSKWQLFIPPSLAYGERGAAGGKIGPDATLIFEVELISIKGKEQVANGGGPAAVPLESGVPNI